MIVKKKNTTSQLGFSLFELLLAIGVVVALLTAVTAVLNDTLEDAVDRKVAREMQELHTAATEYVRLNMNTIIVNDIPDVGDVAEINISDLTGNGFLPDGYRGLNSYRQSLRVLVRYSTETSVNGDTLEVISFSEGDPVVDRRLFNAASNAQKNVGIISSLDLGGSCCDGNIQSLSRSWSIPLTDFPGALAPTPPGADGGYMAAYSLVSNNDQLSGDYLFRDSVPGLPERNRMETNLDLNGNDITNAGIIVVDSMNIGGNAVFNGLEADGTGSPYILSVRDSFETQNLSINANGNDTKGNLSVDGDDAFSNDFIATGDVNISDGDVSTNILIVDGAADGSLSVDGVGRFNTLNNNNATITASQVNAGTTIFQGTHNTAELQASFGGNINSVNTPKGVSSNVTVVGGVVFNNTLDVQNAALITGNSNVGNITSERQFTIKTLDRSLCGVSCP